MKNLRKTKSGAYEARIRIHPWERITYKGLGTKDKVVAQKRLDDLYRQMERESEGLVDSQKMKEAAETPLSSLVRRYLSGLDAGQRYILQTQSRLNRLCADCGWKRIKDIDSISFEQWRVRQDGYTPKTLNHYLSSIHSFCAWLVENGLSENNPVSKLKPIRGRGRQAFKYRALTPVELCSLISTSKRSLIYRLAAYTGLRYAEVKALEWGDVRFPLLLVRAETTKNGKGATIKLHPELIPLLMKWKPATAEASDKVFPDMPDTRTVLRDFGKAGIPTNNARKEKASFHSLRKTFCSMLHLSGVPQRIAQEAMRHGSAHLTNDVYFDRNQASTGQAIDSLPGLSITQTDPPNTPQFSDFSGRFGAFSGKNENQDTNFEKLQPAKNKQDMPSYELYLAFVEWCTGMDSNHHAIAGTRT